MFDHLAFTERVAFKLLYIDIQKLSLSCLFFKISGDRLGRRFFDDIYCHIFFYQLFLVSSGMFAVCFIQVFQVVSARRSMYFTAPSRSLLDRLFLFKANGCWCLFFLFFEFPALIVSTLSHPLQTVVSSPSLVLSE